MTFSKILIANRGEIACRVIRTARALGYRTVAVYSDADAQAPHVALADESVRIGPAPAAESYLLTDALLTAARLTGADAVHPGYGFLSERADFAQACTGAGLVFIGPPAAAITAMGDKAVAKRRMVEAGVPCAPGYLGEDQSDECLLREATRLQTPLLVKAVNGGGGRGMRLVRDLAEVPEALAGARREATSAFGDGTLMLERLIEGGRHIEIQVFADAHGNAVHLGERDCTAQRRRQKVIEEAPSPIVSPQMRAQMGHDAVAAALAVGYQGAGTVEFIVDSGNRHYFLEMNTRLQVEHPVTECVTGLDLVEWQLRVAAGEPLPLQQQDIQLNGHAIEVRLYAEDPYNGFAPQTGPVAFWRPELALAGRARGQCAYGEIRIDAGIREGGEISPWYDPMVAKLIAHGRDRNDAIRRLRAALEDSPLLGVRNNARFLRDLLDHPDFRAARMHTTTIDQWVQDGEPLLQAPLADAHTWALAAAALVAQTSGTFRPNSVAAWSTTLSLQGTTETQAVRIRPHGAQVAVELASGEAFDFEHIAWQDHYLHYRQGGVQRRALCLLQGGRVTLALGAAVFVFEEKSPFPQTDQTLDPRQLRSPVAGTVCAISVAVGDPVKAGQPLVCVEAMKMEMWLSARADGTVTALHTELRGSVAAGSVLAELELTHDETTP
ncbi:acetyl/propionyl/methylcrotonyl-CoA carboxylase subunit alpha [Simplicispira hankyongi]|uniref:ATP-grasp domain-containing protein n=1 Tax=Simplicispira hankyongi TaxID=2315688 RepID=A0A398CDD6_9BURK|nr:biotin carboxylase N-terminal domain-containing protein [Simplicispira hankyongi]RID99008.1 ATP-grasp domain-containing protein [Simplicispira hankyongi]